MAIYTNFDYLSIVAI